jgi:hypothetical protein
MTTNPKYEKIADLTPDEIKAARAYGSESGFFHLACQADHSMALGSFQPYQDFCNSGKLVALKQAASSRFRLTEQLTVYSGHGNGFGVVGGFGSNNPSSFEKMSWKYKGFTSTSVSKLTAEHFLEVRAKSPLDTPVFLEFRLPVGFHVLPMAELGPDSTHEGEFIIAPQVSFDIAQSYRTSVAGVDAVLYLILTPTPVASIS